MLKFSRMRRRFFKEGILIKFLLKVFSLGEIIIWFWYFKQSSFNFLVKRWCIQNCILSLQSIFRLSFNRVTILRAAFFRFIICIFYLNRSIFLVFLQFFITELRRNMFICSKQLNSFAMRKWISWNFSKYIWDLRRNLLWVAKMLLTIPTSRTALIRSVIMFLRRVLELKWI